MSTVYENNNYKVLRMEPSEVVLVQGSEELHNWGCMNIEHGTWEGTFMSLAGAIYAADHMDRFLRSLEDSPDPMLISKLQ